MAGRVARACLVVAFACLAGPPWLVAAWDLAGKSDGTCGLECTEDADAQCNGCGKAGKCGCPDGQNISFFQTSCTCVSAPMDPPSEPKADVADSVWPGDWTADVDAWCYGDFSNKTATAKGKFYYSATLGKTRADWSPYINGKDARQVWIGDMAGGAPSTYYVKTGPVCISFAITDPGQGGAQVGVEKADWMKSCKDAGFAKYVGREQVESDGEDVWVDHWSCRLDYVAANQSITFQNWHSLGLNKVPKGYPLRVTGGNSAPNPTKGSPRLNTVWYKNFTTGTNATKEEDFQKPNWGLCIPVGAQETESFFGEVVQPHHVWSPDFHRRAHFLPHASPSALDLRRAKQPKPGRAFMEETFAGTMQKLNAVLQFDSGLKVEPCSNFSMSKLHEARRLLFNARSPQLHKIYQERSDTRVMAHSSLADLESEKVRHESLAKMRPWVAAKVRDGMCHETVMWYVHHLSEAARDEVKESLILPLLPEVEHQLPHDDVHVSERQLHGRYQEQVSCAICHVAPPKASGAGQLLTV